MSAWLIMLIASVVFVGLFALGMSLTLIFKGHHIESEISSNPNMRKLGIRCVVEEARESAGCGSSGTSCGVLSGSSCGADDAAASGGCVGCSGCGSAADATEDERRREN